MVTNRDNFARVELNFSIVLDLELSPSSFRIFLPPNWGLALVLPIVSSFRFFLFIQLFYLLCLVVVTVGRSSIFVPELKKC